MASTILQQPNTAQVNDRPRTLNAMKISLAFACLMAVWHSGWAILVKIGAAQDLLNWILGLHFIEPMYKIQQFSFETALALVAVSSVIGFLFSYIFVACLNMINAGNEWFE